MIHKSIIIPVSFVDDKPRFLTVRDRRFKEWIFITGGCRKREYNNPLKCAIRELEEETRGVLNIKEGRYSGFSFQYGEDVIYNVYILITSYNRETQSDIVKQFNIRKQQSDERKRLNQRIKRVHDENDYLCFETLEEFNKKPRWSMIVTHIINNPEFYIALNSPEREDFNMLCN